MLKLGILIISLMSLLFIGLGLLLQRTNSDYDSASVQSTPAQAEIIQTNQVTDSKLPPSTRVWRVLEPAPSVTPIYQPPVLPTFTTEPIYTPLPSASLPVFPATPTANPIPTPTLAPVPAPAPTPTPVPTPTPTPTPIGPNPLPIHWEYASRTVSWNEISLNGGVNEIVVDSGADLNIGVQMDYTHGTYCPGCVVQFYVRINNVFAGCMRSGSTSGGGNVTKTFPINAPTVPGTYYLQPRGSLNYSCGTSTAASDAFSNTTLGTIIVIDLPIE